MAGITECAVARNNIKGGKETCPGVVHIGTCFPPCYSSLSAVRNACAVAGVQAMVCLPLWSARRDPGRLQNVLGARSISKNAGNEVLPPVRKRILILFGLKKRLRPHFQRFLRALAAVYCGQGAKAPPTALRAKSHHLKREKRNMQRPHSQNAARECEPLERMR